VLHCLICSPVLIHSVPKPAAVFLLLPEPISQPVLFLCFDLPQQGVSPTDQAWVFASVVWIPASRWFIFILELCWLRGYPSQWKSSTKSSSCVFAASRAAGLILEPLDQRVRVFLVRITLSRWFSKHTRQVFSEMCKMT
jgi:hypothetical protein